MKELIADLIKDGFEAYVTSVGGSGLGVLSPYNPVLHGLAPATPPDTPGGELEEDAEDGGDEPLRSSFEHMSTDDFVRWADGRGRWLFV